MPSYRERREAGEFEAKPKKAAPVKTEEPKPTPAVKPEREESVADDGA